MSALECMLVLITLYRDIITFFFRKNHFKTDKSQRGVTPTVSPKPTTAVLQIFFATTTI